MLSQIVSFFKAVLLLCKCQRVDFKVAVSFISQRPDVHSRMIGGRIFLCLHRVPFAIIKREARDG